MSSDNLRLVFKEQYWCISTLCALSDADLKAKVDQLDKYAEERLHAFQLKEISPKFVPSEQDRNMIIKIAQNLDVITIWKDYIENFEYSEGGKTYNKLGILIFRVRIKKEAESIVNLADIRPNHMQQVVFRVWNSLTKDFKDTFRFDDGTPPYIFSVCSGTLPSSTASIQWTAENINRHKEELGQWIEIYSGQFPDYRESLYDMRIEGDISNRKSEMHFLNRNSSLLYMDPSNYAKFFIKDEITPESTGYMYDNVILPSVRIRTISFAMLMVNTLIDQDTKNLLNKEYTQQDPSVIKKDLEKTSRLRMILQNMLAPFFTEMARSHRQHYSAVLHRAVDIFNINSSWETIAAKIESNVQELNSIFLDSSQDAQERQEKILSMVNVILGAGVLFEIISYLITEPTIQGVTLQVLAGLILAFLIILLIRLKLSKGTKKKDAK